MIGIATRMLRWAAAPILVLVAAVGAVLSAGAGVRLGARGHRMLNAVVHMVTLLILLGGTWWWLHSVHETYLAAPRPPRIGIVEIHGDQALATADLKREFPSMILAEVADLQAKANQAIEALHAARSNVGRQGLSVASTRGIEVSAPSERTEPLAVELKVADVDLGSLLSWLYNRSASTNQLRINILVDKTNAKSRIYGSVAGRADYTLSLDSKDTVQDMARDIAAAIIARESASRDVSLGALARPESVDDIIEALSDYASLETRTLLSKTSRQKGYKAIYEKLKPHAEEHTGSPELQWLTARAAEEGGLIAPALVHYGHLKESYTAQPKSQASERRLVELETKIAALTEAVTPVQAAGVGTVPPNALSKPAAGSAPTPLRMLEQLVAAGLDDATLESLRNAVGIAAPIDASGVRIGIVGVPDAGIIRAFRGAAVGPMPASGSDAIAFFDDYISSLAQTALHLVRGPQLSFAGPTDIASSQLEVARGITQLVEAGQEVIVVAFGGSTTDPALRDAIRAAANTSVVVLAAGNGAGNTSPSPYAALTDVAVVAAALEGDAPAGYTLAADGAVWVPGGAPYFAVETANVIQTNGTSVSAAIAAGLAAALVAEFPQATPDQVVAAMKEASGGPPERPIPLRYEAAGAALRRLVGP